MTTVTTATSASILFDLSTFTFAPTLITWGPKDALTSILVSELTVISTPQLTLNVTSVKTPSASDTKTTNSASIGSGTAAGSTASGSSTSAGSASSTSGGTAGPGSSNTGVSVGKAVGIGIGSAFAAALLLALVAAVCFWRRRDTRKPRNLSRNESFRSGRYVQTSPSLPPGHIQEKLPQPITREDITKEASRLESAIRNYVENFTDCQTSSKSQHDGLRPTASDLSEYTQYHVEWATLLQDDSKRSDVLRMFIARVLTARISSTGAISSTLLPAEVLKIYQQIVSERENDQYLENLWRTLTTDLLSNTYSTSTLPVKSSDPRSSALEDTVAIILKTLDPYRHKRRGSEKREHETLIELVSKAALLGLRLFMQTTPTELFWSASDSHGHAVQVSQSMEVFPGVRQWAGVKGSKPDIIRQIITQ